MSFLLTCQYHAALTYDVNGSPKKNTPAYQGDITMKRKHLQWALENAGNFYINFI